MRSDGETTRERILEVALPLFAAHGFAGTSVRAVASAAGVNVATLAYHFDDKAGLYDTVVQRLHEDLAAGFPVEWPTGTPEQVMRAFVGLGWGFAQAHREHLRLLVRHVLDHGEQPVVVVERWSDRLLTRAERIVAPFRPEWPPERHRLLILSMMHLTVRLVLENPGQLSRMTGIAENALEAEVLDWLTAVALRELGVSVDGAAR